jgi:hypothetical protein
MNARIVPESWAESVVPALEFWRAHRDAFAAGADATKRKQLAGLASDNNPMIAYFACRTLANSGALGPDDVPAKELDALDERGCMADYLLLGEAGIVERDEEVLRRLSERVAAAKSPEQLHGMAVACSLDLATTTVPGLPTERSSYHLLLQIETRATQMAKDGNPDRYLIDALQELQRIRHESEVIERIRKRSASKRGTTSSPSN